MTSVVVIDDHPIVRDGIVAALTDARDFSVAGCAGDTTTGLALVERVRPDVVVLDLELPGGSGLDAIAALKRVSPATRVVIFSAYAGEERVGAALGAGADGYVLKGTDGADLLETLRAAVAGTARLSPQIAAQALGGLLGAKRDRITPREREILGLLAAGLANKEIAARLGISERTVKFHVGEVLARLGASNRAQAVAIAKQRGLI